MKKLILFLAFIGLTLSVNAQNKKVKERATEATEFINKTMKLNDANKSFLYKTLLNSFDSTYKKAKGVPKEQKKTVYKEARKSLNKALSEKFSKDEVKQINTLLKEYKKQSRKKNKK